MISLPVDHPNVYSMFVKGRHAIYAEVTDIAGLSTDLVIEQMLMCSIKSRGGLTRGRGMTEV